ncbi:zinc finger (C2H2 type) family protein [Rhynchospora pubera]|uniref:Zinc finger (C2H2 type) family protein n=1 Tax=Rhynchospora pubera TaxID=906938 RepID=A0AAV8DZ61_9POAL|nr:zinc finger (C2H2 type) family protein [Rhynchospora pubera]
MGETRKPREKPCMKKREKETIKPQQRQANQEPESPSYRLALKSIFNCKSHLDSSENHRKRCKKNTGCSASASLCKQKETNLCKPEEEPCEKRRASISACTSKERLITKKPLNEMVNGEPVASSLFSSSASSTSSNSYSSSYSIGGSFRGIQFRRFSGCYECHSVVDPVLGGSMRVMCTCHECGEIFVRSESLEHHQAIRHAVSELGPEDTSRNIIEIIFQSSWLKKNSPICTIERILKVQNSQKTITKFEDYRDSIKLKSSKFAKKYPRCIADGNELLRFHCTTLACTLGLNGSTNLCSSNPVCHVCNVIKDGFKPDPNGRILTMATSGRAHDAVKSSDERRAMLVCRVIAGRVRRTQLIQDASEEYDSLAGASAPYSNLDELFVFNPRAILPCFVVIYKA